jgi:hypothetical protein
MTDHEQDRELQLLELLADALPPQPIPAEARALFHADLRASSRYAPFAPEIAKIFSVPLASALTALARIDDPSAWLAMPTPGSAVLPMHGRVVISRLPAGMKIPRHKHKTREITYVLDGILVSDGVEHARAACCDMAVGTEHELHVGGDDDCVVVFLSQPSS